MAGATVESSAVMLVAGVAAALQGKVAGVALQVKAAEAAVDSSEVDWSEVVSSV